MVKTKQVLLALSLATCAQAQDYDITNLMHRFELQRVNQIETMDPLDLFSAQFGRFMDDTHEDRLEHMGKIEDTSLGKQFSYGIKFHPCDSVAFLEGIFVYNEGEFHIDKPNFMIQFDDKSRLVYSGLFSHELSPLDRVFINGPYDAKQVFAPKPGEEHILRIMRSYMNNELVNTPQFLNHFMPYMHEQGETRSLNELLK